MIDQMEAREVLVDLWKKYYRSNTGPVDPPVASLETSNFFHRCLDETAAFEDHTIDGRIPSQ